MVLDTANARVYVDGRSEIIYLPREIEIVARLGTLCTELADEVQREAEPIAQRYRNPCDAAYDRATPAGVRRPDDGLSVRDDLADEPF
jgi:hypothetical protein